MKYMRSCVAATLIAVPSALAAQQAPIVIEQHAQQAGKLLKQGTPITLTTLSAMSSNENRVGDRVEMRVADAVTLDGQAVIPAGTRAVGEITVAKKKGMWGKSGKLEFRPLHLKLGDRQVALASLTATKDSGKTGTTGVVAAVALLPIAGFFVTGTSATIPAGTPVAAELAEDVTFVIKEAAPPPQVFVPAGPPQVLVPAPVKN